VVAEHIVVEVVQVGVVGHSEVVPVVVEERIEVVQAVVEHTGADQVVERLSVAHIVEVVLVEGDIGAVLVAEHIVAAR
jgi:hypothetical protein